MFSKATLSAVERYLAAHLWHGKNQEAPSPAEKSAAKADLQRAFRQHATGRPFPRILVAVDREKHPAVKAAFRLAEATGAVLAIVHVVDRTASGAYVGVFTTRDNMLELLREAGAGLIREIKGEIPADLSVECISREGLPAAEILATARESRWNLAHLASDRKRPDDQDGCGNPEGPATPRSSAHSLRG